MLYKRHWLEYYSTPAAGFVEISVFDGYLFLSLYQNRITYLTNEYMPSRSWYFGDAEAGILH